MSLKKELLDLLNRQKGIELKLADELSQTSSKLTNAYARFVVDGLVLDSRKHALWLQAIMDMGVGPVQTKPEKEAIKSIITKHAAAEEQVGRDMENVIKKVTDPTVIACLEQIANDEKRHHQALEQLAKIAAGEKGAEVTLRSLYKSFGVDLRL